MFCIRPLDSRLDLRRHYGRATHDKRTTRWKVAQARELARHHQVRLELEREKRTSLRTSLIRQYEEETRPKWAQRERESVKGSDTTKERRNYVFSNSRDDQDIQCGIFWDIENVNNEYNPFSTL